MRERRRRCVAPPAAGRHAGAASPRGCPGATGAPSRRTGGPGGRRRPGSRLPRRVVAPALQAARSAVLSFPAGAEAARRRAPVAQLDRASDYGSEGQGVESSRAHHTRPVLDGSSSFRPDHRARLHARTRPRTTLRATTTRGPGRSRGLSGHLLSRCDAGVVASRPSGGEGGIRTLDGGFVPPYSLSRGAPSAARPPLHACCVGCGLGGGGGIRTPGRVAPATVFKNVAFDRSANPPV